MATRIAVAQFCAGQSVATNLATCIGLMSQACKESAKVDRERNKGSEAPLLIPKSLTGMLY